MPSSRSQDVVIRVYDAAGNAHQHERGYSQCCELLQGTHGCRYSAGTIRADDLAALQKFAKNHSDQSHDVKVQRTRGTGEFVGEADTRAEAQGNYDKIIADYKRNFPDRPRARAEGPRGDRPGSTWDEIAATIKRLQRLRGENIRRARESDAGSGGEGGASQGQTEEDEPTGTGRGETPFRTGGVVEPTGVYLIRHGLPPGD